MKSLQDLAVHAAAVELGNSSWDDAPPTLSHKPTSWLYNASNNITYYLDKLLCILDGAAFAKKTPYLLHNFAPVHEELHSKGLTIQGQLPADLQGAFIRTGPNPHFDPIGRYHWFDGDGMIHAVRLGKDGTAAYCNQFVDTAKLRLEKAAGRPVVAKFGDMRGIFGILHLLLDMLRKKLGIIKTSNGLGSANTALTFHAGRLLALHEGDAPYWIRLACDGLISTISRFTFEGQLHQAFTAHPKIDPVTKEMFAFGYSVEEAPHCWLYRCNAAGELVTTVQIPLEVPVMMHDFAMTEKHVVFIAPPLVFRPEAMVTQGTLPFVFDKQRSLRIGVLDRYAETSDGITWFELPSCMVFHVANAWERVDGVSGNRCIELYVCVFGDFSLDELKTVDPDSEPYLSRVILDLDTGAATLQKLSPIAGDFPVLAASKVGRPTRFAYVATFDTDVVETPTFTGIAKIDLSAAGPETAIAGRIEHGSGRIGGEAVFVSKKLPTEGGASALEEDDGYLMTYIFDEERQKSELVVYDAKSMSSTPLARVMLETRVPYGFHGMWVTEEQLKQQG